MVQLDTIAVETNRSRSQVAGDILDDYIEQYDPNLAEEPSSGIREHGNRVQEVYVSYIMRRHPEWEEPFVRQAVVAEGIDSAEKADKYVTKAEAIEQDLTVDAPE